MLASVCWKTPFHLGPGRVSSLLFVLRSEVVEQGVYKSAVGDSIAEPARGHCTTSPPPGLRSFDYGVFVVPLALYKEGAAMEVAWELAPSGIGGDCSSVLERWLWGLPLVKQGPAAAV